MNDKKNRINELSKLAIKGMVAGAFAFTSSAIAATTPDPYGLHTPVPGWVQDKHQETHGCHGLNVCKGLGGCKVDAATLKTLATAVGTPMVKAGTPHSCAGKNECKGLGGCAVDAKRFATLKAQVAANAKFVEIHACAGLNICKGLGGCAVDAAKLKTLAAAVGVAADKAGSPHGCNGKNECKGLGGCSVDAAKLATLKKKKH